MSVTKEEVQYIAELAQLYFSDTELEEMRKDMDDLVNFAHSLSALDTQKLEPLSHVQGGENVFDKDVEGQKHDLNALLQNAPESTDNYFAVPKVVD